MKTKKSFLWTLASLGAALALLPACSSNWQQDPLAHKDRALQNGQQKPSDPQKPEGVRSDEVRLQYPEVFTFQEGIHGEFTLVGRILLPGYTPTIVIENMDEFPGAVFDAATGKFSWTPAVGTVKRDLDDTRETRPLKVSVVGQKSGDVVVQNTFVVKLDIAKTLGVPEIFEISKAFLTLREGERADLTVRIRDLDAGADPATWPKLQILPMLRTPNLSQFVTLTDMDMEGNGEFTANLKVDLRGAELTKSKTFFGFSLQATSRYQKSGKKQDITVVALTSFSALQSTWFDTVEVNLGSKSEYQFLIFDPKEELQVDVPEFTEAPAGMSFACKRMGIHRQLCKAFWVPDPFVTPRYYRIRANVRVRNQDSVDSQVETQRLGFDLSVLPAPTPTPTPSPTPSATPELPEGGLK